MTGPHSGGDGAARAIGFFLHPDEPPIEPAVDQAARLGFRPWATRDDAEAHRLTRDVPTALLVTVGGDGTFLRGARLAAEAGIPVLGVNRGRLGFLTEVELPSLPDAIASFAEGDFRLQRRSLIELVPPGGGEPVLALNEVAVKARGVSVVRLHIETEGELFGDFDCDGVVIATATGSTGYALSAGGPPVDPRVRALVVVPLAPHAVITRPVVLPEAVEIRLTNVFGRAFSAADGQHETELPEGATLLIRTGPELSVVRIRGAPSFLARLRRKVHFGIPLKPPARAGEEVAPGGGPGGDAAAGGGG